MRPISSGILTILLSRNDSIVMDVQLPNYQIKENFQDLYCRCHMQIFLTTTPDKTVGTLGRVPILSLHKVENNS